jgi:hypothetical protein
MNVFFHFLLAMGRYDECLLYLDKAPANPSCTSPDSLLEFAMMVAGADKGAAVRSTVTGEPLFFKDGVPVLGLRRWRAYGVLANWKSMVSKMHVRRITTNTSYVPACVVCIANYASLCEAERANGMLVAGPIQWNGCFTHPSNPRLLAFGNSTYEEDFKSFMEAQRTGNKFTQRGRKPLDLVVVKGIILTQFSLNDQFQLMLAVMMMLAINDYLREDEFGSFGAHSIMWDYCNFNASPRMYIYLTSLAYLIVRFMGKRDNQKYQYHQVMRNDACPLFCLYTLLQLWFLITDWDPAGPRKDLYMFPKKTDLDKGNFQSHISYGHFETQVMAAIERSGTSTIDIGTQSFRKTAYKLHIAKSRGKIQDEQQMQVYETLLYS